MENSTSLMGSLHGLCDWIMRFSIINMLWIIFNIPIILVTILMIFTDPKEGYYTLAVLIALLMPLLFFPATTAMFASVRQWVMQGTISPLLKSYWGYYKENYKKSFLGGVVLTAAWTVLIADYYYFVNKSTLWSYIVLIIGIFLFVFSMNFFSVVSHYNLKLGQLFKNALLVTIGNPLLTVVVFIGSSIILYVSFYVLLFLIPLFTGILIAYLSFALFYRMYLKTTTIQMDTN
ncbi:DUF624 domain-containing protein [Sporosarcina sp. E16_8]|uniref:YesL family protein n=1 Tax=Sporosarcina sp. E16_8 TaxID=2789295 RepID=UPI0021046E6A|nr:DUF624 domain-containing protein [Sporosarcina sp. E16_8]